MSLEHPYYVYGRAQDDGSDITSTWVYAKNTGSSSGQTDGSGYYYINLQNITNDGESVSVYFDHNDIRNQKSFVVDISGPAKELNFYILYVGYNTPTGNPTNWIWDTGRFDYHSGMCSFTGSGDSWQWYIISSSSTHLYPSGSPTHWRWVSGSAYS